MERVELLLYRVFSHILSFVRIPACFCCSSRYIIFIFLFVALVTRPLKNQAKRFGQASSSYPYSLRITPPTLACRRFGVCVCGLCIHFNFAARETTRELMLNLQEFYPRWLYLHVVLHKSQVKSRGWKMWSCNSDLISVLACLATAVSFKLRMYIHSWNF